MHINIEKAASAYSGFFANIVDKGTKKDISGVISGSFQASEESMKKSDYFGYDKESKLINEEGNSKNADTQISTKDDMQKFLNDAIDMLKNIVTDDDYSQLAELGIIADKDDLGTIVTVYERIQIQLAAYSDADISNLNISNSKIDKVITSPNVANSIKMAESIGDIDDNAKKYILKNEMEPTVENVYMAVHANEANTKNLQYTEMMTEQWEQLKPQVEKFLNKNGIEADEKAMEGAKWLLDNEISLTTENLIKYAKLKEIESSQNRDSEAVKANILLAEIFGMNAGNAYMTTGWIDKAEAKDTVDIINGASDRAIKYIANHNLTLNAANIEKYQNAEQEEYENREMENYYVQVLVEAKAVMTMEGAVLMQKLGISVKYTDIEVMVNEIKSKHTEYTSSFLDDVNGIKTAAMINIMDIMSQMSSIPVAAIGSVADSEDVFSIGNVYNEGIRLKERYETAGETYEAVGTQVRNDLGDSMNKAFANVDILIEEAGLEADWYTRRAVRILGYNTMEITSDNIIKVAEKASEVDRVIKNITPKTAAYLVEHGINPLDEDIEALNDRLEAINIEIGADENEQYSKYLWKLEKSGEITVEQRQAYIELYRMLKTISKADARSIGAVISEGAGFTLGNLFSAERSRKKYGMDVEVNKDTGFYQGRITKNKLSDILENMNFDETNINEGINEKTVEELWQSAVTPENIEKNRKLDGQYQAYVYKEIEKTVRTSEDMIYSLLDGKETLNMANLSAVAGLISNNGEVRMLMKERLRSRSRIMENFNSEEEAYEAYKELDNEADEIYAEALDKGEPDYLKYKGLCNMTAYMVKAAANKTYNIPVDIDGRDVIVKVRFSHTEDNKASIDISLNDERFGNVKAELKVVSETVSGIIICTNQEIAEHFKNNENVFGEKLKLNTELVITTSDITPVVNTEAAEHTDRELYETAKSFLTALKVLGEMPINNVD